MKELFKTLEEWVDYNSKLKFPYIDSPKEFPVIVIIDSNLHFVYLSDFIKND